MKKIVSAFVSAALTLSAAALPNISAAETKTAADTTPKKIVVLGDSIASGYGLSASEYNYGALMGDYYGAEVVNKAVAGASSKDVLDYVSGIAVSSDSKVVEPLKADTYVISVGGNDMMQYASKRLLLLCAKIGTLKDGYTKNDIPEIATFSDVQKLMDEEKFKTFFSNADFKTKQELNKQIVGVGVNISIRTGEENAEKYERVLETQTIPNIKKTIEEIKIISPDAQIIVQDVYNPLQYEKSYYDAAFTGSKLTIMNIITPLFTDVTESFRDQLNDMDIDGVKIADVYGDITSIDENGQKYGWYFTKIQSDRAELDIHPTQAGHVAIAAKVIDTIGTKNGSGDLIVKTFDSLANKDKYPAAALATYKKITANTLDPKTTTAAATTTTTAATTKATTASKSTATAVSTTAAPTTTAQNVQPKKYEKGDPNGDGLIDAADASLVLADYSKVSTGGKTELSADAFTAADVDGSKLVDASDASFILLYYALASTGKNPSFSEIVNG